jgi:hypothetical protein
VVGLNLNTSAKIITHVLRVWSTYYAAGGGPCGGAPCAAA